MKYDPKKFGKTDEHAENIFRISPYYYLFEKNNPGIEKKKVIFFGCCFRNLPPDVDLKKYVQITNKCLDYVRHFCAGYDLYYKPHPAELDEFKMLDLRSFSIEKDRTIGEPFLYKNIDQIKYVFSAHSSASTSAFSLGLNSYVFIKLFSSAFGDFTKAYFQILLGEMSKPFFISDLSKGLSENKIPMQRDDIFEKHLTKTLESNNGTVWFIVVDPGLFLVTVALSKLIKEIFPGRKVGLIIMRHERWDSMNMDEFSKYFDKVVFFPKVVFSLRAANLSKVVKTVFGVKRFKIDTGDILFGVGPCSFLENCFISYYKNNFKIAIITQQVFGLTHHLETPLDKSDFEIKKSALVFNKIIEPILGLNQAVRVRRISGKNGSHFTRYQDSVDKIFDAVYVIKPDDKLDYTTPIKIW